MKLCRPVVYTDHELELMLHIDRNMVCRLFKSLVRGWWHNGICVQLAIYGDRAPRLRYNGKDVILP